MSIIILFLIIIAICPIITGIGNLASGAIWFHEGNKAEKQAKEKEDKEDDK